MMKNGKDDRLAKILACLIAIPLVVLLSIAGTLLGGWAMNELWAWFVVPLGLPPITIAHAIGISTLLSLFKRRQSSSSTDEGWKPLVAIFIRPFVAPLVAVGIGWIILQFMQ